MHSLYELHPRSKVRRKLWLALIEQWRESGLSKTAFCSIHGLKFTDLKRWLYRYRDKQPMGALLSPQVPNAEPPTFLVPVEVTDALPEPKLETSCPRPLLLRHSTGWAIEIPGEVDVPRLYAVIKLLGSL